MKRNIAYILFAAGLLVLGYRLFSPAPEIKYARPTGTRIICFGDSLTSGYGAAPGMDYPSQLSDLLDTPVINAGVPGDTTRRALERLDSDVLSRDPRIVLITLGGNDLKNRVPKARAFDNLTRIVEAIQAKGALVILGGIDIPFYDRGFADAYRQLADDTGAILIPDILEDLFGNRKLMSDTIHPNNAGYRIMAQRFYEAIPEHFK